ncbi:MAG: DUF3987 domain-containing protein [Rhodocyclaceae bacterium]|nr:DUF3987 domain-containing protein [Rhodocyclaceae bacterium]
MGAAHDRIEQTLAPGGELADIRYVAAKAAENIVRLAALFHVLAHGLAGVIGTDHVTAAEDVNGLYDFLASLRNPSDPHLLPDAEPPENLPQ